MVSNWGTTIISPVDYNYRTEKTVNDLPKHIAVNSVPQLLSSIGLPSIVFSPQKSFPNCSSQNAFVQFAHSLFAFVWLKGIICGGLPMQEHLQKEVMFAPIVLRTIVSKNKSEIVIKGHWERNCPNILWKWCDATNQPQIYVSGEDLVKMYNFGQ